MGEELGHAYRRCDRDDAIRVVVVTKRLLWDSANLTRVEVGDRETALHHHLMSRSDAREGVLAYLERRPPRWAQSVNDDWPD
jgi:enoyl-CoA hydratase/carnithine racemase